MDLIERAADTLIEDLGLAPSTRATLIAALRAALAQGRRECAAAVSAAQGEADDARSREFAALAQGTRLARALAPFVEFAHVQAFGEDENGDDPVNTMKGVRLTINDWRRAAKMRGAL